MFLSDFGVFRQISLQFSKIYVVSVHSILGLRLARVMVDTLGRDNCASRYLDFTSKDHKSIKNKKKKLD